MSTNSLLPSLDNLRHSLYWRISLAFFALFLLLGIAFIVITTYSANRYYEETTQKLHAHVAEYLLS